MEFNGTYKEVEKWYFKMNNKKAELNLFGRAIIFIGLFFLGAVIGLFSLPNFPGRFYISGLVFATFGMGLGKLIIHGRH